MNIPKMFKDIQNPEKLYLILTFRQTALLKISFFLTFRQITDGSFKERKTAMNELKNKAYYLQFPDYY